MMIMRFLFIASTLLAAACSAMSARAPVKGKVLEVIVPPAGSGYFRSFVATTVIVGKSELKLLIPFLSNTESLPSVGNICEFAYENRRVDGWVGEKVQKSEMANVVTRFACTAAEGQ